MYVVVWGFFAPYNITSSLFFLPYYEELVAFTQPQILCGFGILTPQAGNPCTAMCHVTFNFQLEGLEG